MVNLFIVRGALLTVFLAWISNSICSAPFVEACSRATERFRLPGILLKPIRATGKDEPARYAYCLGQKLQNQLRDTLQGIVQFSNSAGLSGRKSLNAVTEERCKPVVAAFRMTRIQQAATASLNEDERRRSMRSRAIAVSTSEQSRATSDTAMGRSAAGGAHRSKHRQAVRHHPGPQPRKCKSSPEKQEYQPVLDVDSGIREQTNLAGAERSY